MFRPVAVADLPLPITTTHLEFSIEGWEVKGRLVALVVMDLKVIRANGLLAYCFGIPLLVLAVSRKDPFDSVDLVLRNILQLCDSESIKRLLYC